MEIVIDLPPIDSNPLVLIWWFFKTIGWIIPVFLIAMALLFGWQNYIRNRYRAKRKYILLAIDVPKHNEQTPKAVENIFNQLAGAHQPLGRYEKWWAGEIPDSFSFELISIGGYIQFIIHIVDRYRDLIEAMIYAQYPDAEITEVEDYTKDWNIKFPNDRYQLWGSELRLGKNQYYPIRTYPEFEDPSAEYPYKDSMAALLEAMSRIGPGEHIWTQVVVTPADNDWDKGVKPLVDKLIGTKGGGKKSILDSLFGFAGYFFDSVVSTPSETSNSGPKEPPNKVLYLTESEKNIVKAIGNKAGKIGFHCRIRIIYLAEKSKYKSKIPHTVYGTYKQFNTSNLNNLKPNKRYLTGGIVWFKERRLNWRRNRILYNYKQRGHWLEPGRYGTYGQYFNSEELATIYHFPVAAVSTLLKTTEAKKAQAPISLPIEEEVIPQPALPTNPAKAGPPENLPT